MRLARRPHRAAPETIVALIDVVFFLLVFFLLIGRMDATAPFEVLPPLSDGGTDLPGGGATVAIGADGAIALDGVAMSEAAVIAALRARLGDVPDLRVRVNAHGAAPLHGFLPLAAEIEALGAREVVLVVTPGGR
jgi:biopolymer transport protein ExbD